MFSDTTIAESILDRVLQHCNVATIKSDSYRLNESKNFIH